MNWFSLRTRVQSNVSFGLVVQEELAARTPIGSDGPEKTPAKTPAMHTDTSWVVLRIQAVVDESLIQVRP